MATANQVPEWHPAPAENVRAAPPPDVGPAYEGGAAFTWAVWAVMSLSALVFVAKYGVKHPAWDEWLYVPLMTGQEPLTFKALWAQHNPHRIPLAKLIQIGLLRGTHYDFRSGMVLNALLLSALAAAMIRTARRLRGTPSYTDAFFPMVLLHLGHWENLLWSFQLCFTISTTLAGMLLLVVVTSQATLSRRAAILYGIGLLLLPLLGLHALVFVPAMSLWLILAAIRCWRSPAPAVKRNSGWMLAFAMAGLILVGLNFVDYHKSEDYHPCEPRAVLRAVLQFLTISCGNVVKPHWTQVSWGMLGFLGASLVCLGLMWYRYPVRRFQVVGLLLFLFSCAALACLVGMGRAGVYPDYVIDQSRYATLSAPILCALYLLWGLVPRPAVGRFVQASLLLFIGLFLLPNVDAAIEVATYRQRLHRAFAHDVRAGMPLPQLLQRHGKILFSDLAPVTVGLRTLHQLGVGRFAHLNDPAGQDGDRGAAVSVTSRREPPGAH